MRRQWSLRRTDPAACLRLRRELNLRDATARCLVARGLADPARAGSFLEPRLADLRRPDGPGGIAGFDQALDRLIAAIEGGERVGVFGDYDVDGVTTCALLGQFLAKLGADVRMRVAQRHAGYGFGEADAAVFVGQGCRLVVTCDTGTSDIPAILACRAAGVDVVVIDHHQVPDGPDHPAVALVNPHRPDSPYPFRGFASVGLGFMLAAALRTRLKQRGWFDARPEPDPRALLDLVAVGTIADMAPLTDENRVLVKAGLTALSARRRPGFMALLDRAEVERDRPLDAIDVSFRLAPRLNAPGRLGDAEPALRLLAADDLVAAVSFADTLEQANQRRRELTEIASAAALAQAEAMAGAPALVVGDAGWHPGVVGIVAAKLVERFGKSACVIGFDEDGLGRGSLRAGRGANVYQALAACAPLCERWGGHAQAAGVTLRAERLDDFRTAFVDAVGAQLGDAAAGAGVMQVDALVGLDEVDERLATEIGRMAPFGVGNEAPLLAARGARVRESRLVGGDRTHLKLTLESERGVRASAIGFRLADRDPGAGATIDVAFQPEVSQYRGATRVELKLHDLRLAPSGVAE